MNIILMGPPGSGKGTLCKSILSEFNYHYISAGDLLRNEISSNSKLGKKIASIIDIGGLVPDEIITKIVFREFRRPMYPKTYFLIDGYPRTNKQALDLNRAINVQKVIWLGVSEETTIERNLKRGLTSGRPDDSNIDIIKQRIKNYNDISLKLKDFYGNRIIEINGELAPDEVYVDFLYNLSPYLYK